MAKQFKDFNKEAKDLLTKNFPAGGSWKFEAKEKAADKTVTVSTTAEYAKAAALSADVDYNMKEFQLDTKTTFTHDGAVKPKITYKPAAGHKIEASLKGLSVDADFEIVYEGNLSGALVMDKITKKQGEVQVAYAVGNVAVGAGATYAFAKGLAGWSAGVRFVQAGITGSVVTKDAKTYTTGLYYPLKLSCCTVKTAVQVDCGHDKCNVVVGAEAPLNCCNLPLTVRAKVAQDMTFAVSLIKKLANNWTAVVSVQYKKDGLSKAGVQLTRE
eukprot:CAMPEP_0174830288 /NCGR_PEP_ID=MMETSP1114-20130205/2432_1 /TAXON_ID=312471 /ORGANISM="Neobodo designis, Strain CCAP 1951/1" /LENGTH=270 /DNA_ID=CAMNT_0016064079 /DNA_START=61 /DNA_END=873 /DNA_ORIENTATION=+